jgi:hypothetical protein
MFSLSCKSKILSVSSNAQFLARKSRNLFPFSIRKVRATKSSRFLKYYLCFIPRNLRIKSEINPVIHKEEGSEEERVKNGEVGEGEEVSEVGG